MTLIKSNNDVFLVFQLSFVGILHVSDVDKRKH